MAAPGRRLSVDIGCSPFFLPPPRRNIECDSSKGMMR